MLAKLNFKSKKGMSLAVALTICLFMILVTGGITTVALLQQTETGSNMNTRQAYISAKSGLDVAQNALRDNAVNDLPSNGETGYYVMYYKGGPNGPLRSIYYERENDARSALKELMKDGHTIVGGEGTYFKVVNKGENKHSVTALNTTGKYNNNVSMNRGDLSFDMIHVKTYEFELLPTEKPSNPSPDNPSSNSRFMLVGQQTCLNEATYNGQGNQSTGRTLNQYFFHQNAGANADLNCIYYIPYNENRDDTYAYTYFPVVYDKMVKVTSDMDRVSLNAVNEGFYLLGEGSGDVSQQFVTDGTDLGLVSYITQNEKYRQAFGCKFFCIRNNFVTIRRSDRDTITDYDPVIKYSGNENKNTVVAYVSGTTRFYILNTDKKYVDHFDVSEGYYEIYTGAGNEGAPITDKNTWKKKITDSATIKYWTEFNMYGTIDTYIKTGEIHTGTEESNYENVQSSSVRIITHDGKYNTDQDNDQTGFSKNENWHPTYSVRTKHNIFMSPNFPITEEGYYNWYCGRSLNFQWFRNTDTPLTVANGAHVRMSAPTIVLTIGPTAIDANGKEVKVSNVMSGTGDASWCLYGSQGPNSADSDTPTLHVMSPIQVKYSGGEYTIKTGVYKGIQNGLNLFSDEAKKFFVPDTTNAGDQTPQTSDVSTVSTGNASVMPASVTAQTIRALSLFNSSANRIAISPMVDVLPIKDNVEHIYRFQKGATAPFSLHNEFLVDSNINKLIYDDGTDDGKHSIPISSTLTIKMKKSEKESVEIIKFKGESGRAFEIPAKAGETEFDIYNGGEILDRAQKMDGENYKLVSEGSKTIIIEKYY